MNKKGMNYCIENLKYQKRQNQNFVSLALYPFCLLKVFYFLAWRSNLFLCLNSVRLKCFFFVSGKKTPTLYENIGLKEAHSGMIEHYFDEFLSLWLALDGKSIARSDRIFFSSFGLKVSMKFSKQVKLFSLVA